MSSVTQVGNDVAVTGMGCPYCGGATRIIATIATDRAVNRSRMCTVDGTHRFVTKEVLYSMTSCLENADRDESIAQAYIEGAHLNDLCSIHNLHLKSVKRVLRSRGLIT